MRTTLTQRIAAAEELIEALKSERYRMVRQQRKDQETINKLVAERDAAEAAVNSTAASYSKLSDDLGDAKSDNDALQARLARAEGTLKRIRGTKHTWWMMFVSPKNCPICACNPEAPFVSTK